MKITDRCGTLLRRNRRLLGSEVAAAVSLRLTLKLLSATMSKHSVTQGHNPVVGSPSVGSQADSQAQATILCPCGSTLRYKNCCQPAIDGTQPATTAQALMRSRYSAYVLGEVDYLITTTHPDHRADLSRESLIEHHQQTRWLGLTVLDTTAGNAADQSGTVHFRARFAELEQGRCRGCGSLQENSNFVQLDQRWYYCDGDVQIKSFQPERNAPCPCGSGKKYKKCCA
ncbi:MAG: YchJ family protein [Motiliproteus sp.]